MPNDDLNKLNRRKHLYLILQNVDKVFFSLGNVYSKFKEKEVNKIATPIGELFERICKLLFFFTTVFVIILSYYFYVYWNLIPRLEGTNSGFTLKFWKQKNWDDYEFRSSFIHFIMFHILLIVSLICYLRTIFTNPGYLHDEYTDIYSIVNFLKIFFEYILNFRDAGYALNLKRERGNLVDDIRLILESRSQIKRIISEYKESYLYNSLEVNMQGTELEIDNSIDYYEESRIQARTNILDGFENFENEYLKFIGSNENKLYSQFYQNVEFKEKNLSNKRFCSFCLVKKPDRTHHCRNCQKCVRRSDHHCHILSTCIGYSNYKFFFLTLFYLSVLLNYMFLTSFHLITFYICEYKNTIFSIIYLTYFVFTAILTGLLTFFTCYHLMFLVFNLTTIEYKEKIKGKETNNFFNIGLCLNLKDVFGTNFLLWLIPVSNFTETSGYTFKINEETYEEIIKNRMTGDLNPNSAESDLSPSPTPV